MKKKFTFGLFVLSTICGVLICGNVVSAQKPTADTAPDPTEQAAINGSPAAPEAANSRVFIAYMNGASEVPTNTSAGRGYGRVVLNDAETQITASFYWSGLATNTTIGHIHCCAAAGVNAAVLFNMNPPTGATSGVKEDQVFPVTAQNVADLRAGLMYFNIHTVALGGGEIRGQLLAARAKTDYDGDGRSDYGVVRQGPGGNGGNFLWFIQPSNGNASTQTNFGKNTDIVIPADYDGDGKTDIAVWRQSPSPAIFYVLRSSDSTLQTFVFGISGDTPITGDFTGDGKADPAVYRASTSTFWYFPTSGPFFSKPVAVPFGAVGDFPVPGDFNGDGKADFCVYHNTNGIATFNVRYGTDLPTPGSPDTTTFFGRFATDSFIQGDFDGDGKADPAVTRVESGQLVWYYLPSSGGSFSRIVWGLSSDFQTPGDYDGDGKTDQAIWRASSTPGATAFYVLKSGSGFLFQQWGLGSDTPVNFDVTQ